MDIIEIFKNDESMILDFFTFALIIGIFGSLLGIISYFKERKNYKTIVTGRKLIKTSRFLIIISFILYLLMYSEIVIAYPNKEYILLRLIAIIFLIPLIFLLILKNKKKASNIIYLIMSLILIIIEVLVGLKYFNII